MKVSELVLQVEKRFLEEDLYYGHGTDNPWDEAVALVFFALEIPFDIDDNSLENFKITSESLRKVEEWVSRRIHERKPLSYLTHQAYFAGLKFYVDERVIIPRSPFAELIEHQFRPWINPKKIKRILDLCTGSGCMAIACAKAFPKAIIDATDLSSDALDVARINVEKNQVQNQVTLWQSDLFDQLPKNTYDLIISNPPYVSFTEMAALPIEYQHEPKMALEASEDGLALVARILNETPSFLSSHGLLAVEVGNSETALIRRFPSYPFIWPEFERGGGGIFLYFAKYFTPSGHTGSDKSPEVR